MSFNIIQTPIIASNTNSIIPSNAELNLGSEDRPFNNIYANNFIGQDDPSRPQTINVNIYDSANNAHIGTTTAYIQKQGRIVVLSIQAFTTTTDLSQEYSYLLTDLEITEDIAPINDTSAPDDLLLSVIEYSYPLAGPGSPLGDLCISSYLSPNLIIFGDTITGGFDSLTTITVFNASMTYISKI